MPHESTSSSTFDMEILEYDEAPIFVVETSTGALPFDILYSNRAFRNGGMGNTFRAEDQGAIRFRAWAQALGQPVDSRHDFADYTWSVRAASKSGALKVIAGTLATPLERILENLNGDHRDPEATSNERDMNRGLPFSQPRIKHIGSKDGDLPALLRNVPRTNFNARWEGIQTMLEMSDVGVFEYNMDGALMYANDAWYKLRLTSFLNL
jgi:PAS domain-containing protein